MFTKLNLFKGIKQQTNFSTGEFMLMISKIIKIDISFYFFVIIIIIIVIILVVRIGSSLL